MPETIFTRAANGHLSGGRLEKLQKTRVLVAGLGGGSNVAELLARKGFGSIVVVDPDTFEPSNVRQRLSLASTWGKSKATAVEERLRDINPGIHVSATNGPLTLDNVRRFVEQADVVIDMLDFSAFTEKVALYRAARNDGKYAMTAPSFINGAMCIIFAPDGVAFDTWLSGGAPVTPELVIERFGSRFPDEAPKAMYMEAARGARPFPLDAVGVDQAAIMLTSAAENLALGRLDRLVFAPAHVVVDCSDARFLSRVFP